MEPNSISEETIITIVVSEPTDSETRNIITLEPIPQIYGVLKRTRDEEEQQNKFNIGYSCKRSKNHKWKKEPKKKPNKKNPTKKRKLRTYINDEESVLEKEERLLKLTTDYNPIVSYKKIREILTKPVVYNFSGKITYGNINIIIPNLCNKFMDHQAYWYVQYVSQTFFEWKIWFNNLANKIPLVSEKPFKNGKEKIILGPSPMLLEKIKDIYDCNMRTRWAFKKLCRLMLLKKCSKRQIGTDRDLISLEPIPAEEIIKLYCLKSRSKYIFSGNTVVKTLKSSLESQVSGIPYCNRPKNPFTNVAFTYGQLITLYNKILRWCSKKGKAIPPIIACYRDVNFNILRLTKLQNNYLQYKATNSLIHEDDITWGFFLENLAIMLDAYTMSLLDYDIEEISIARFKLWLRFEPKNPLIKLWKQLISDYWYYEQTSVLIRDLWRSDNDIIVDITILLQASKSKLANIYNEYNVRPFRG